MANQATVARSFSILLKSIISCVTNKISLRFCLGINVSVHVLNELLITKINTSILYVFLQHATIVTPVSLQ